eukprot:CCRYP_020795-RA/>CCRYP_020795-RA protein AED:0.00 eAED:0.00 QI:21/1/1/1/0/0/2/58/40
MAKEVLHFFGEIGMPAPQLGITLAMTDFSGDTQRKHFCNP